MAIGIKSTVVAVPTSGSTFDVTISGIGTPVAMQTRWVAATTNDVAANVARFGYGHSDGATHRAYTVMSENGQLSTATDTGYRYYTDAVAALCAIGSETEAAKLSFNTWITDGVTLNIDAAPASSFLLEVTFFYGTGITAAVASGDGNGTSGNSIDFTDVANCDFIFGASVYGTSASGGQARISLGMAARYPAITQGCYTYFEDDRPTGNTAISGVLRDDCFLARNSLSEGARLAITFWDDSLIRFQTQNASQIISFSVLALKLDRAQCWVGIPAAADLNTDTTGDRTLNDPNIEGKYAFAVSTPMTAKNTFSTSGQVGKFSYGVSDATINHLAGMQAADNVGTGSTKSISSNDFFIGPVSDTAGLPDYLGTLTAFTSTGFTINIPTALNSSADRMVLFGIIGENRSISLNAIGSAEAFGTITVQRGAVSVTLTGIPSANAFGTLTVAPTNTITLSGIASSEAFGTVAVQASNTISLSGIPSSEAFGTIEIQQTSGTQTIDLTGIPSSEAFGSLTVAASNTIALSAIPSSEAFGTLTVSPGVVLISLTGIPSSEAFGTLAVAPTNTITLTGISSSEAFGTLAVQASNTVELSAIPSSEAFGTLTVSPGAVSISLTGIPSSEAFGTLTVSPGVVLIELSGIGSSEAFGTVTVQASNTIELSGIGSSEAFGTVTVSPGAVSILLSGIPSSEAFGTLTVQTDAALITLSGIPSSEAFGALTVAASNNILLTGIGSNEVFGTPTLLATNDILLSGIPSNETFGTLTVAPTNSILLSGIASAEAFGTLTVSPGAVLIELSGIGSSEAFGTITIVTSEAQIITLSGIPSAEAFGLIRVLGGALPATMKKRVHDALCAFAKAGRFIAVTYDYDACEIVQGTLVEPSSVVLNEVSARFRVEGRKGRAFEQDRASWRWQLILQFNEEVIAELFENDLLEDPICIPRSNDEPEERQARITLEDVNYEHPVQGSPSNGSLIKYHLEATLSPR